MPRLNDDARNNIRQNLLLASFLTGMSDAAIAETTQVPMMYLQRLAGFGAPVTFVDADTLHRLAELFHLPYPRLLMDLDPKTFSELKRWHVFRELSYADWEVAS